VNKDFAFTAIFLIIFITVIELLVAKINEYDSQYLDITLW